MSRAELRTLFLFEGLSDEQLDFLLERGEFRTYDAGAPVFREGDPSDHLYVLVDGAIRLSRLVSGQDVVVNETDHRGSYGGAVRAYMADAGPYNSTMTATVPSRFFRVPGTDFSELVHRWFPMAVHLLDGLYVGIRSSEAQVRQREHLAGLGVLSANLAHELNNPAAATVRASSQLRSRVAGMRAKLGMVASGKADPRTIGLLVELQERAVERAAKSDRSLSPMEASDAEDELADHLEEPGRLRRVRPRAGLRPGRTGRRVGRRGGRDRRPGRAGGRAALAGVHAGDRGADGRDRGRVVPHLGARRDGQGLLAHGPGGGLRGRPAQGPGQHGRDARREAGAADRRARLRPDAAARTGVARGAQPGLDEPARQRRRARAQHR